MPDATPARLAEMCALWRADTGRIMHDGAIVLLVRFAYTYAIVAGATHCGYFVRYCYEHRADALEALEAWDGTGDPGGPWIKAKGPGRDDLNPALFNMETGARL